MRKKQFGKLLTISLSDECYGLVEKIANAYQTSMSGVIRDSIEYSVDQKGAWKASKPRPFAAETIKGEPIDFRDWIKPVKDVKNVQTTGVEEGSENE